MKFKLAAVAALSIGLLAPTSASAGTRMVDLPDADVAHARLIYSSVCDRPLEAEYAAFQTAFCSPKPHRLKAASAAGKCVRHATRDPGKITTDCLRTVRYYWAVGI